MKIRKIDLSDAVSERESKKVRNFKRIFFVLSIVGLLIVLSLNLKTKQTVMFSSPRDLWMDNIKQRINATYEIGKKTGSGLSFAEDKIDDILGLTIHYGVLINFDGFGKAIDLVDGIDIEVPTTV